jgi:hypothetical protein
MPYLALNSGIQYFSTSGWTRVEPAPVIVAPAVAVATELATVTINAAVAATPTNLVRVKGVPFESRPFTTRASSVLRADLWQSCYEDLKRL